MKKINGESLVGFFTIIVVICLFDRVPIEIVYFILVLLLAFIIRRFILNIKQGKSNLKLYIFLLFFLASLCMTYFY